MNSAEIIKEQIDILRKMQNDTSWLELEDCQLKIKTAREIVSLVLVLNALQHDNDYSETTQHNNESYTEAEQCFEKAAERIEQKLGVFKNPWG